MGARACSVQRLLRILGAVLVLLGATGAPRAHALEIGMGDQKARMFADPRFQSLGVGHVRLVVPWDALRVGGAETQRLDEWLGAARAYGHEPLVAFNHSRVRPRDLPSVLEYQAAFALFRQRYPWVHRYTTWNEANLASQPTAAYPEQVAQFYDVMRSGCPECTVVAADVLDQGGMVAWVQRVRAATGHEPGLWGVHNYLEVNRPDRHGTTAQLLAEVPGKVWLTETGGIVEHVLLDGQVHWPYDEQRAAAATARAFQIARSDDRIDRIYLYQWSVEASERWDSAFVGPSGTERPSLELLRQEVGAAGPAAASPPSFRAGGAAPGAGATLSATRCAKSRARGRCSGRPPCRAGRGRPRARRRGACRARSRVRTGDRRRPRIPRPGRPFVAPAAGQSVLAPSSGRLHPDGRRTWPGEPTT